MDARSREAFEQAYESREEYHEAVRKELQDTTQETGDVSALKHLFDEGLGRELNSPDSHRENWIKANPLPSIQIPEPQAFQRDEFSSRQIERLERIDQEIETSEKQLESARRALNTSRYYSHHTEADS